MSLDRDLALVCDVAGLAVAGAVGAEQLLERFASGAVARGLPISRAFVTLEAVNPLLRAQGFLWRAGEGAEVVGYGRTQRAGEGWRESPLYALYESAEPSLRLRLERGEGVDAFPVLRELRAEGATDYVAFKTAFSDVGAGEGIISAWSTGRQGGFTQAQLARLRRLLPVLEVAVKSAALSWTSAGLLGTYLGADAARRVLAGEVDRGVARPLEAIVWTSDLAGFTRLSEARPAAEVIDLLNAYAEPVVAAIEAAQGQVLKFMGDGLLATFDVAAVADASRQALSAAATAMARTEALGTARAARGLATTSLRLALHRGEVSYGNVGSPTRLDFTVIGPTVNEAARLCDMCRALDQAVIVSSAFRDAAPEVHDRLVGLGRYALRGVGRPQALWTLDGGATR